MKKTGYTKVDACDPRCCIASKIMKIHRIVHAIFRKHLKGYGLTNSQMSILFFLSKKGKSTQTELSKILYLEKSSVSRNMRRLYEKAYVSKAAFPIIEITDEGLALLDTMIPQWDKAMAETMEKLGEDGEAALNLLFSHLVRVK